MKTEQKLLRKGFRFPIYPTETQKDLFERTFGCCRYVWNKALADSVLEYKIYSALTKIRTISDPNRPDISGYGFVNRLTSYKSDTELSWLNDVSSVALQQSMLHLGSSYSRFFKERKGFPKFKKKHDRQAFSLMKPAFTLNNSVFTIAKSKEQLKVAFTRNLPSAPSSCTISKTPTGKYYVSFVCEYLPPKTQGQGKVGIDLGIKDFATLSTGEKIANPKPFIKAQNKLKRLQQSMSRKQKGSSNRNKARLLVAQQHERVSNTRRDFQHKLSRRLVNENQVIGLEKLMVKNMVKNRKLSKHISDAAWSSFTDMLQYKTIESQHCTLVYMDAWYPSSHLCSETHLRLGRQLKLSEREWSCPHCGQIHDRDINAALNIKHEALAFLDCKRLSYDDIAGKVVLAEYSH